MFYALSAFLLSYPYFVGKQTELRTYYLRRALRIYPLYVAVLLLNLLLAAHVGKRIPVMDIGTHLLFIHSWFLEYGHTLIGGAWSLGPEVQFYVLLPALMVVALRAPRVWMSCGIALSLTFLVLTEKPAFENLPALLGPFFMGIVAASFAARGKGHPLLLAVGVVGYFAIGNLYMLAGPKVQHLSSTAFYVLHPLGPVSAVSAGMAVLGGACNRGRLCRFFAGPAIRMSGVIGYSIFLLHLPVRSILFYFVTEAEPLVSTLTIPLTIMLSLLTYRWIEHPAIRAAAVLTHKNPKPA